MPAGPARWAPLGSGRSLSAGHGLSTCFHSGNVGLDQGREISYILGFTDFTECGGKVALYLASEVFLSKHERYGCFKVVTHKLTRRIWQEVPCVRLSSSSRSTEQLNSHREIPPSWGACASISLSPSAIRTAGESNRNRPCSCESIATSRWSHRLKLQFPMLIADSLENVFRKCSVRGSSRNPKWRLRSLSSAGLLP